LRHAAEKSTGIPPAGGGRRLGVTARDHILRRLADGRFHSGQQLAGALGLSRGTVWKQVQRLREDLGLSVHAIRGRGYRLALPIELLDGERIQARLDLASRRHLDGLNLLTCTPSTNSCAKEDPPTQSGLARVWLAEHQTAGRGRRGRGWVSAFGENLYLSLAWRFDLPMAELAGLSLAAGVAVAEVLNRLGLDGHSLKWPNDVLFDGRKLSGILVEVAGESGGPATAVIGVGVNVRLPDGSGAQIDQPWTDLCRAGMAVSRNDLAGTLVQDLIQACRQFARQGLEPFLARWGRFDRLPGKHVRVTRGDHAIEGVYRGISPSGGMLLENAHGCTEHHAGEVSLRRPDGGA
jgi:BirA family biotin operon repressor/biotin-[acetyl-CoA-carboxylase] ligase